MRMIDCDIERARREGQQAHNVRIKHDLEYQKRWILRNGMSRTPRNRSRSSVTLARLTFMERPELFPEI